MCIFAKTNLFSSEKYILKTISPMSYPGKTVGPPTPPPYQNAPPQWQSTPSPMNPFSQRAEHQGAPNPQGDNIPPYGSRIQLCQDGKYRWIYEMHMMKNPVIFFTVLKIFGWIIFIGWLIMSIFDLVDGNGFESILNTGKVMLLIFLGFIVLTFLGYTITAAINGWKYVVLFEMDDNGLLHRQMKEQVKKAKAIGWLTVLAGAAAGNLTTVGIGINAATKTSSSSNFASVRSVKPLRRWNTIKVNEPLSKNQVYVEKEDFDFVYNYIMARCPKVKQ